MSDQKRLRVICYDIPSDKLRDRVADRLDGVAARVQYSVYEARLTDREAERLFEELNRIAMPDGNIRLYTIPDRFLVHCLQHGGAEIAGAGRFWIV